MDNNKKNSKILQIFKKIKEHSVDDYPDEIDPNKYLSVEQFIRILTFTYGDKRFGTSLKENIQVAINKHKYGIIVLPSSKAFNDDENKIYELSKMLKKMDSKVKGWVIDLRSNTGGNLFIFALFTLIFIPGDYNGLIWSLMRSESEIISDVSIYNGILYMRQKYDQFVYSGNFENKLIRIGNNKRIKILIDDCTVSGPEFICLVLKSFGAKIYGDVNKSGGALSMTVGYIIDNDISMFFPNAYVYDKNNLEHNIYLETSNNIKSKYLLP